MEAVLRSVTQLDETELRSFVQRCLRAGILPVEAASAQLHKMSFEAVCLRCPWACSVSFDSMLHVIPSSCLLYAFLSHREWIDIKSSAPPMLQYVNHCSAYVCLNLRARCSERGIIPPSTFDDEAALHDLLDIASRTLGASWTLQSSDEVYEAVQSGSWALRGLDPGEGNVFRVSFLPSQDDLTRLRSCVGQLLEAPGAQEEFSIRTEAAIMGMSPPFLAELDLSLLMDTRSGGRGQSLSCTLWVNMNVEPDEINVSAEREQEWADFFDGSLRFFPVGFGCLERGHKCTVDDSADEWLYCECDAEAAHAQWCLSIAFQRLLDALTGGNAIYVFLQSV